MQEKCIVVSDRTVCSRLANEGKFLLDTVFQSAMPNLTQQSQLTSTSFSNPPLNPASSSLSASSAAFASANNANNYNINSNRALELTLYDAQTLLNALRTLDTSASQHHSSHHHHDTLVLGPIIEQLDSQLRQLSAESSSLINSWTTVRLFESYSYLLNTFQLSLDELKRISMQSPAIPVISLLLDRLYRLDATLIESHLISAQLSNNTANQAAGNSGVYPNSYDKRYMCSEVK